MKELFAEGWKDHRLLQYGLAIYLHLNLISRFPDPTWLGQFASAFFCSAIAGGIINIINQKGGNINERVSQDQ